jgi:hypothetical protein
MLSLVAMPGWLWAGPEGSSVPGAGVSVQRAAIHDVSPPLTTMSASVSDRDADAEKDKMESDDPDDDQYAPSNTLAPGTNSGTTVMASNVESNAPPPIVIPAEAVAVEQTNQGNRRAVQLLESFDGLGASFTGPQGTARLGNPSDNTLAVGPDHIIQIVNTRIAVFTKKGSRFDTTGKVLLGPVETRTVFKGFGDADGINNGDAVVRYDQLAKRWLIVMPIFRRLSNRTNVSAPAPTSGAAVLSMRAVTNQPGNAQVFYQPPPLDQTSSGTNETGTNAPARGQREFGRRGGQVGPYAICYAVSTSTDPLGSYYRYEFIRPLFPDYPRPAVWPDGYYVASSTGDNVIQKQVFVVERKKMLRGEDAREQGIILDGVNFLNCADIDGRQLPPSGAPNIVMAAGGTQLKNVLEDDRIYVWKYHVDWNDPGKTRLEGPKTISVAPYHYLGGGQLTSCVPQPGSERRLDSQGDKIMQRVVYRRIGNQESIVAVHSIATSAGGGGVRWYEFRIGPQREVQLRQQGTYAPEGAYRWMASPAMDAMGNIGIGYSFGSPTDFPGQRFAGRLADDPMGMLTLHETVLAEGETSQTNTLRWEDYAQTAMDPSDDRTIWYVGDYLRKGDRNYSTRIGAFRLASGN